MLAIALKIAGEIEGPFVGVNILSAFTEGSLVRNVLGVDWSYIIRGDSMIRLAEDCFMKQPTTFSISVAMMETHFAVEWQAFF